MYVISYHVFYITDCQINCLHCKVTVKLSVKGRKMTVEGVEIHDEASTCLSIHHDGCQLTLLRNGHKKSPKVNPRVKI